MADREERIEELKDFLANVQYVSQPRVLMTIGLFK